MIRGEATLAQIIDGSHPYETGVLNLAYENMRRILSRYGAIASNGKTFLIDPRLHPPQMDSQQFYVQTTGSHLQREYGIDIGEHDITPSRGAFVWRSELMDHVRVRRFKAGGIGLEYSDSVENGVDLTAFTDSFGQYIRNFYNEIGVMPTYPVQSTARCFIAQIVEEFKAVKRKLPDTLQPQPTR